MERARGCPDDNSTEWRVELYEPGIQKALHEKRHVFREGTGMIFWKRVKIEECVHLELRVLVVRIP
ncbi:MAG: hypothetical protein [Olavius algarvensis Gamma 1 endosymbiont]|nr:MAG: hypothetical protein [Olavius algarvensis Gamma 1 endosymbiont]